jgi:hypothetical protein
LKTGARPGRAAAAQDDSRSLPRPACWPQGRLDMPASRPGEPGGTAAGRPALRFTHGLQGRRSMPPPAALRRRARARARSRGPEASQPRLRCARAAPRPWPPASRTGTSTNHDDNPTVWATDDALACPPCPSRSPGSARAPTRPPARRHSTTSPRVPSPPARAGCKGGWSSAPDFSPHSKLPTVAPHTRTSTAG